MPSTGRKGKKKGYKQETREFAQSFGTIIIDECHHIPAETYRKSISKLTPYYQYGLTSTPFRKGNDGKIIFIQQGEIIAEIKAQEIEKYKRARIIIRNTSLHMPFNLKTDPFEILSKVLVHNSARNRLILNDLLKNENVKHYRHLRYLASKHDGSVLKLRFDLDPFSFVFLLSGTEQYHVVLETLDTEEATYILYIDKSILLFPEKMRAIDQDLKWK